MSEVGAGIVVVGAGAVGLAAALAFARAGRDVVLVGAAKAGDLGRTVALLPPALSLLRELETWDALEGVSGHLRRLRVVEDAPGPFGSPDLVFEAAEAGLQEFGRNVPESLLVRELETRVAGEPRVRRIEANATRVVPGPGEVRVEAGGEVLRARLVVAADGRRSGTRASAGIGARSRPLRQTATTAILAHDGPHDDTSTEFHTPEGPFVVVPLPGRRCGIVLVTAEATGARLAKLGDEAFAAEIAARARHLLGAMRLDGPRGLVPLGFLAARRMAARRVALVGEAAHAMPPTGAQGLNLSLGDVTALVRLAGSAADPGAPEVLAAYDADRLAAVRVREGAVALLHGSMPGAVPGMRVVRGIGAGVLAAAAPLRRALMRAGLGDARA